jgi:alpha-1,2-mannosyltransferase
MQEKYPRAVCVVYTGDHDASKPQIIARVKVGVDYETHMARISSMLLGPLQH